MSEVTQPKRPRIIIDLSGGNIQKIVADGGVDVLIVDFDNVNDPDADKGPAAVETAMTFDSHDGDAETFETELEGYRSTIEDALLDAPAAPRP